MPDPTIDDAAMALAPRASSQQRRRAWTAVAPKLSGAGERQGTVNHEVLPRKLADGDATRLDGVHRDGERGPRKVVMV